MRAIKTVYFVLLILSSFINLEVVVRVCSYDWVGRGKKVAEIQDDTLPSLAAYMKIHLRCQRSNAERSLKEWISIKTEVFRNLPELTSKRWAKFFHRKGHSVYPVVLFPQKFSKVQEFVHDVVIHFPPQFHFARRRVINKISFFSGCMHECRNTTLNGCCTPPREEHIAGSA